MNLTRYSQLLLNTDTETFESLSNQRVLRFGTQLYPLCAMSTILWLIYNLVVLQFNFGFYKVICPADFFTFNGEVSFWLWFHVLLFMKYV